MGKARSEIQNSKAERSNFKSIQKQTIWYIRHSQMKLWVCARICPAQSMHLTSVVHVQAATWILSMVILNYSYMKNHLQFSVSTVL